MSGMNPNTPALGIEVLRFDNRQVLTNIEGVLQVIYDRLTAPHPSALPGGEGVRSPHSEAGTVSGKKMKVSPL